VAARRTLSLTPSPVEHIDRAWGRGDDVAAILDR